jgi:hypothetical protein
MKKPSFRRFRVEKTKEYIEYHKRAERALKNMMEAKEVGWQDIQEVIEKRDDYEKFLRGMNVNIENGYSRI